MNFRSVNETEVDQWSNVIDVNNFEMKLPITPYRSFPSHEVSGGVRVVRGLDLLLRDNASLNVMIESVRSNSSYNKNIQVGKFILYL